MTRHRKSTSSAQRGRIVAMWHLRPSFLTPRPGTLSIRQVPSTHRGAFCAPPRTCEAGCAPCTGPCCPPLPLADLSGRSTAVCTPNAWYASGKPEDRIPPGEGAPDARRAPREEEGRTAQRVHLRAAAAGASTHAASTPPPSGHVFSLLSAHAASVRLRRNAARRAVLWLRVRPFQHIQGKQTLTDCSVRDSVR